MKRRKFYAYFVPAAGSKAGAREGVTETWGACERSVSGKAGARFKAFDTKAAADAWLKNGAAYEAKAVRPRPTLAPGIYFDAGTGRGEGVEVSVTDERGRNLLHKAIPRSALNAFGKHPAGDAATNNYGELLALRYALTIARTERVTHIFGDSRLVIDYWSRWRIKRNDLPAATVALAEEVSQLREKFEKEGGAVARIPGDHNPADLGFHR